LASRPIFIAQEAFPYVKVEEIDFKWHPGLSVTQKKNSIKSLHEAASERDAQLSLLEISTKSDDPLGVNLSAFNLSVTMADGRSVPVENIFQSSKVFERGGPFKDLLNVSPKEAKRDPRLLESGDLVGFISKNRLWPLQPVTIFYDWIYINTLRSNKKLAEQVATFNAFTDIEFNPKKSINCQARSAALFVSLQQKKLLDTVLASPDVFIETFSKNVSKADPKQSRLF